MDYDLSTAWTVTILILVVWELAWKGVALWKSSRRNQRNWFIALLIINSLGILPIIYLLIHMERRDVSKGYNHEKALPVKG